MSGNMTICDIDDGVKETLHQFRFRKDLENTSAIIIKVDREKQTLVIDQILDNTTIEDLKEELPSHQPRYVVLSYKLIHTEDANRVSYPLCFIFISPRDSNPDLSMMYAGSKLMLQKIVGINKVYECRELEELDEEWLQGKLL